MAFKANIPLGTDKLSTSQNDILNNFQAINTFTAIDHVAFNAADQGMHKSVTMPVAAAPAPIGAGYFQMYAADDPSGNPQVWIDDSVTQIPINSALKANPGWTYLPSGIILQWSFGTMGVNVNTISIALLIPFTTAFLSVQGTPNTLAAGDVRDNIITTTPVGLQNVTVRRNNSHQGTACSFNILAIGY